MFFNCKMLLGEYEPDFGSTRTAFFSFNVTVLQLKCYCACFCLLNSKLYYPVDVLGYVVDNPLRNHIMYTSYRVIELYWRSGTFKMADLNPDPTNVL